MGDEERTFRIPLAEDIDIAVRKARLEDGELDWAAILMAEVKADWEGMMRSWEQ